MGGKAQRWRSFVDRVFWYTDRDGNRSELRARFAAPIPDRNGDYLCRYALDGFDDLQLTERKAYQIDSVGALHAAMQMVAVLLVRSEAYQEGRLSYSGEAELGLPVPGIVSARKRTTTWIRIGTRPNLDCPESTIFELLERHLATFPLEEIREELEELRREGSVHLPFTREASARAFAKDASALGFETAREQPCLLQR